MFPRNIAKPKEQPQAHQLQAIALGDRVPVPRGAENIISESEEVSQHTGEDWHEARVPLIPLNSTRATRSGKPHLSPLSTWP